MATWTQDIRYTVFVWNCSLFCGAEIQYICFQYSYVHSHGIVKGIASDLSIFVTTLFWEVSKQSKWKLSET
jgi:hypothetical protein